MTPRHLALPLALAALAWIAIPNVRANVPSPAHSTVDPCLRVCPAGDMTFHVLVRDFSANPVAGSTVVIDLCSCPGVILCPPTGSEPYTLSGGCTVLMPTNGAGVADLPIRAGGTCRGSAVRVFADGILLTTLTAVSSPDQNGDATVSAVDQGILAARLGGPYDPTGDFNCSGALEAGDQAILAGHLGHSCAAVVPVLPGSWGRIKTIYR